MRSRTHLATPPSPCSSPEAVWGTWTDAGAYCAVHGSHRAEIDLRVGGTIDVRFWEDRPGGMSRLRVRKAASGAWSVDDKDAMMLDFSAVNGTWVNCFGSVSPWGTPLTSEELYFDNTESWIDPAA